MQLRPVTLSNEPHAIAAVVHFAKAQKRNYTLTISYTDDSIDRGFSYTDDSIDHGMQVIDWGDNWAQVRPEGRPRHVLFIDVRQVVKCQVVFDE